MATSAETSQSMKQRLIETICRLEEVEGVLRANKGLLCGTVPEEAELPTPDRNRNEDNFSRLIDEASESSVNCLHAARRINEVLG